MLDLNAMDSQWTLMLGLPVIAALSALAWKRARALSARIRAVREEMARSPQDPYMALAMLMEEKKIRAGKTKEKTKEKTGHTGGPQWRKD